MKTADLGKYCLLPFEPDFPRWRHKYEWIVFYFSTRYRCILSLYYMYVPQCVNLLFIRVKWMWSNTISVFLLSSENFAKHRMLSGYIGRLSENTTCLPLAVIIIRPAIGSIRCYPVNIRGFPIINPTLAELH